MRVVLDTNVLISAALKPDGLEAGVVESVIAGRLEMWVTGEIWAEYEEVFMRRKFEGLREASRRMLVALDVKAQRIRAEVVVTAALDEDDNRFLECAVAAQADFIVTGNLRHYPAEWGCTRIVNARGFQHFLDAAGQTAYAE